MGVSYQVKAGNLSDIGAATLMVTRVHEADSYKHSPSQAVATACFVEEKCIPPPASINVNDVIDIKIVYKECERIIYDPHNEIARWPNLTEHGADGAEVWCIIRIPIPPFPCVKRFLYVWGLGEISLYFGDEKVQATGTGDYEVGDEFIWTFHGTIEELLGRKITEPEDITLTWRIGYEITAGVNVEWWPWEADVSIYLDSYVSDITLSRTVHVGIPPPYPEPVFKPDLCYVSKDTVAPDEDFTVKVTFENQNETSGKYYLGYYCEGEWYELKRGTIEGNGVEEYSFTTTAEDLAHREFTESQYLSFSMRVKNEEGETDRWDPRAIAVIVEVPPPPGVANLSGTVTDIESELPIEGVTGSTQGKQDKTDSAGKYGLTDLDTGASKVRFSKSGYKTKEVTKVLHDGDNTLNAKLEPSKVPEISWAIIGGAALVGSIALGVHLGRKK